MPGQYSGNGAAYEHDWSSTTASGRRPCEFKLPINLEDLLRQRSVEGERIEYKAGWNPDATIRTLCAFANDFENLGGGYVVIGQDCDDEDRPVFPPIGLPDKQLERIQRELLQPDGHGSV